jgi:hypothetical protein
MDPEPAAQPPAATAPLADGPGVGVLLTQYPPPSQPAQHLRSYGRFLLTTKYRSPGPARSSARVSDSESVLPPGLMGPACIAGRADGSRLCRASPLLESSSCRPLACRPCQWPLLPVKYPPIRHPSPARPPWSSPHSLSFLKYPEVLYHPFAGVPGGPGAARRLPPGGACRRHGSA